jgi:uncharacterized protein YlxP (DUF503 family)
VIVGCLELTLVIEGGAKEKRAVVRRVSDRVRGRFPVSVAETDLLDDPLRARVGVALATSDARLAQSVLDKIRDFVIDDLLGRAEVVDEHIEVVHV